MKKKVPQRDRKRKKSVTIVCRCEDVTEQEVRQAIRAGYHTVEEIKQVLRTGMGHCQGRGCLRIVARLIEQETGIPASKQKLPTVRPPLKPLPLKMLGRWQDDER
ncbi:hypothetical protein CH330_07765 [candidate division WOR-3 bacterium JGI_Cruoil_03_51_56]|uniref:BFD-like [2Fe-2S]-binding domain-containing protein n=1 Tax=candidate division WOR-3 bacterium JGI_Cruoil_03_51_56 TaxID=1973747 RepID=A0A235BT59_UNCW3|nr:MAG: hypothetical protein CH330_07765 [candidate division WOR-3 bacterium JGI_Cruoil_03_51_56]